MAGKKGMKHYSVEIKMEAMRLFHEEGRTRAEITELLSIQDPNRVKIWLKQYRREGEKAFHRPKGRPRKKVESEQAELERLRMENKILKKLQSELRKDMLARRDIGRSITTKKNTR
jgi:transposase